MRGDIDPKPADGCPNCQHLAEHRDELAYELRRLSGAALLPTLDADRQTREWAAGVADELMAGYVRGRDMCYAAGSVDAGMMQDIRREVAQAIAAAIRRGPQPAVVSDADRGPATADGCPWKGV